MFLIVLDRGRIETWEETEVGQRGSPKSCNRRQDKECESFTIGQSPGTKYEKKTEVPEQGHGGQGVRYQQCRTSESNLRYRSLSRRIGEIGNKRNQRGAYKRRIVNIVRP